jgi:ParB-like chromosome segregation protein Spo0J
MMATATQKPKTMTFHEYAEFFPLIEGDEFTELVEDVRENGLLEPIVLFDGKILDGRNRYRACTDAGVEPRYTEYAGDEPATYVISKNIHRRHLTKTQQSVILIDMKLVIQEEIRQQDEAAGIVRTETGGAAEAPRADSGRFAPRAPHGGGGSGGWSERLARRAGLGKSTIERVERVAREAPDLIPAMREGKIGQDKAHQIVRERKAAERVSKQNGKAREKRREEPKQVKSYLESLQTFRTAVKRGLETAEDGLFSPEAGRFATEWHADIRNLMDRIEETINA